MFQTGQRQGIGIAIAYARHFLQHSPTSAAQLTSLRAWKAAQQPAISTPSRGAAFHTAMSSTASLGAFHTATTSTPSLGAAFHTATTSSPSLGAAFNTATTSRLSGAARSIICQGGGAKRLLQPCLPSIAAHLQHLRHQSMHSAAYRSLLGKPHPCRVPAGHSATPFRGRPGCERACFTTSAHMLASGIVRGVPAKPRTLLALRLHPKGLGILGQRGVSHHARRSPLPGWGPKGVGASGPKGLGATHGTLTRKPVGVRGFAASPRQRARGSGGDSAAQGLYLLALVVLMIGLTYASVPLYRSISSC
jgi:hypothetical protein